MHGTPKKLLALRKKKHYNSDRVTWNFRFPLETYRNFRYSRQPVNISVKCRYALWALLELARRRGNGVAQIPEIAEAQGIPPRFLENILNEMRRSGFVESRRGKSGGFLLARAPASVTVGEVIRHIDGEIGAVCEGEKTPYQCRLEGKCVLLPLWRQAKTALEKIYDGNTLQDLLDAEQRARASDYAI